MNKKLMSEFDSHESSPKSTSMQLSDTLVQLQASEKQLAQQQQHLLHRIAV